MLRRSVVGINRHLHAALGSQRSLALPEHPLHHFQAREAGWLFVRDPHDLSKNEQSTLQAIREASPTAETLYQLVQEFLSLLRQRKGERLDSWLEK
jgi:hypothetical protein